MGCSCCQKCHRLGYRMGMCAVLALWVCWDCVWGLIRSGHSTIGGRTAFPVFRACGGLLLLQWFWGCSVFMWTRFRYVSWSVRLMLLLFRFLTFIRILCSCLLYSVNYIYLFDFDPRIVNSPLGIFNDAVDNTLFFLGCMLLYYKVHNGTPVVFFLRRTIILPFLVPF
jgi:hypothetical protein